MIAYGNPVGSDKNWRTGAPKFRLCAPSWAALALALSHIGPDHRATVVRAAQWSKREELQEARIGTIAPKHVRRNCVPFCTTHQQSAFVCRCGRRFCVQHSPIVHVSASPIAPSSSLAFSGRVGTRNARHRLCRFGGFTGPVHLCRSLMQCQSNVHTDKGYSSSLTRWP